MSGDALADPAARLPVLLLSGTGLMSAVALRAAARLEKHFQVLTASPSVASDEPAAGWSTPTTTEDAVRALDSAGAQRAHVVGLSFGAALAQELAIRHPERVGSLVLGSSTAGGKLYVTPDRTIRRFLRRLADLPAEEGLWATVPYLYADTTCRRHAPLIGEDIARRLEWPLEPESYRFQHAIARAHDTSTRLRAITAPTLVIHGERDRILPLENGRLLAAGIAGAQFLPLPTGAQGFPTDVPDANGKLVSFLLAHSQPKARPGATQSRPATRSARATRA